MRLLKECRLYDVSEDGKFLVDGAWYRKVRTKDGGMFCVVELLTEYLLLPDEQYRLEVGEFSSYRSNLIVIVEVPD